MTVKVEQHYIIHVSWVNKGGEAFTHHDSGESPEEALDKGPSLIVLVEESAQQLEQHDGA